MNERVCVCAMCARLEKRGGRGGVAENRLATVKRLVPQVQLERKAKRKVDTAVNFQSNPRW